MVEEGVNRVVHQTVMTNRDGVINNASVIARLPKLQSWNVLFERVETDTMIVAIVITTILVVRLVKAIQRGTRMIKVASLASGLTTIVKKGTCCKLLNGQAIIGMVADCIILDCCGKRRWGYIAIVAQ